jgi:serine/threonine protein kinase
MESVESLGVSLGDLQLRASNEPIYLGQIIGQRYRLEQILGIGRFGVVYLAAEIGNERLFAVKTIRGENEATRRLAHSLLTQEAQSLDTLRHPGIPELVRCVKEGRSFSIVLQYIEGGTLFDLFRKGRLLARRAAAIVAAIADALDFAHRKGFIHRDLTLANILVDKADRPYLADFGLALSGEDQFDRDGQWAGTNGYMAVESILGMTRQMDGRTDIWSAGVILFELLTGQALTTRSSREEALVDAVLLDRRRLKFSREVPKQLRAICEKCLSRDPNNRFHTAGLLRSALREFLKDGSDDKNAISSSD